MLERDFQKKVIEKLKETFPDGYVLKNDSSYKQGIPDLLLLVKNKWAALECKRSEKAPKRPNQEFHINNMKSMSFSSFIYPENFDDVLSRLVKFFS